LWGTTKAHGEVPGRVTEGTLKMARLVVNREEAGLVTHELTREVVTIGRAPLNHIVIDDPSVSAQHAILARFAESFRLKDLHSTNGTQINGVSISDAELKNGDKIRFGFVAAVFLQNVANINETDVILLESPVSVAAAQTQREGPMATGQISQPSWRKLTVIAVAIMLSVIVGGAGWYSGHKSALAAQKLSTSNQADKQIGTISPTENGADRKQPERIATQPQRTAAKDMTAVPTRHFAGTERSPVELGTNGQSPGRNSPTIADPSIAIVRGPWLFPDSSSRYLTATELSGLSSADLWRARNEIYARNGYKFSGPRGVAFAQTLGDYYRGLDHNEGRVFKKMNQYERANVTLIRSIERGR
jgi:pSer/pThr/pTyr-binding forkhead associated (FHA) protein